MESIFNQVWDEVQFRVEKSINIALLQRNIKPTKKLIEDELDKRMIIMVEKLCDLAFQED